MTLAIAGYINIIVATCFLYSLLVFFKFPSPFSLIIVPPFFTHFHLPTLEKIMPPLPIPIGTNAGIRMLPTLPLTWRMGLAR